MTVDPASASVQPPRGHTWKWWVCGLLLLATMLNYMDRITLNVLSKRIITEFGLSKQDYGELESAFAYAFALGAIIFGWTADRINVRWLYPVVLLAWSAAGFAAGLVSVFLTLWLCRFALGLCEAGHWPCALKTTQRILPPEQRSLGNGILQSGAALGAIFTPIIIAIMVVDSAPFIARFDSSLIGLMGTPNGQGAWFTVAALPEVVYEPGIWRLPFLVIGAVGCFWAVGWLLSVRTSDLQTQPKPSSTSLISILFVLLALLGFDLLCRLVMANSHWLPGEALQNFAKSRAAPLVVKGLVFLASFLAVFSWLRRATATDTHLPRSVFFRRFLVLMTVVICINCTWHFFRVWLPLFLQEERGYSEQFTLNFITAYYISTDIGSLGAGFITLALIRRGMPTHTSRVTVFAVSAVLCLLALTVNFLEGGPLLLALLIIGFAALALFPNYYSFSQELTAEHQGKVTGALGCINWTATYFLQDLFGRSIDEYKSYAIGLSLAGFAPIIALAALYLFWGSEKKQPAAE